MRVVQRLRKEEKHDYRCKPHFRRAGICRAVRGSLSSAGRIGGWDAGFISNQVLRPVNPGDPYIVLTLWASRKDFEGSIRSDAFIQGHARSGTLPKEAYTAPNKLEIHEVVQDSSRPDLIAEAHGKPFQMH